MDNTATQITYRIPQAARTAGVSETTMWRLVKRGDIASFRQGRMVLVSHDALEAWARRKQAEVPTCN